MDNFRTILTEPVYRDGIALDSAYQTVVKPLGVEKGLFWVIVGHATFCVVVGPAHLVRLGRWRPTVGWRLYVGRVRWTIGQRGEAARGTRASAA